MRRACLAFLILDALLSFGQTGNYPESNLGPAYVADTGAVNALVATLAPCPASLKNGLLVKITPANANTTTTPTLNVCGLGAKTITKFGQSPLLAGDFVTTETAVLIYDGTDFELQNPMIMPSVGLTTYSSAFTSLSAAITGVGGAGLVVNDTATTMAASSVNVNVSNLTLQCASPKASITMPSGARLQFANGGTAQNITVKGCSFIGPDMATVAGAPLTFGGNGSADGLRLKDDSINGWGSTGSNGVIQIQNASHIEVSGVRAGDIATGSTGTVSTASWGAPSSYVNTTATGARSGSAVVTLTAGSPATWGAAYINGSAIAVSGCSVATYNGMWTVSNAAAGTATLTYTSGTSTTDTATGCTVNWNSMFGLETITLTATRPSDFVVGNGILCTGMSPAGYNKPGDGQSTYFGQIYALVSTTGVLVQQLYNPGTYVSGGTCQSGVGNGDQDIAYNISSSLGQTLVSDLNFHDNDVGSITVHNSAINAVISGVRVASNALHPGLSNGYYWGMEIGPFQGTPSSTPFAFHDASATGNICRMVADIGNGSQALQGCYSFSATQNTRETGNGCYSGGHTFVTQCDENAAVNEGSSTGGVFNMLGGGSGEDINRVDKLDLTGTTMLYPAPSGNFILFGVANGGVGLSQAGASSFNQISTNDFISRVDVCPTVNTGAASNTCAAQITSCVGAAGTVTCSFTPGVTDPALSTTASNNQIVIANNQVTSPCTASTVNGLQTITAVTGAGTGFSFSNASINGVTCTGGKATGSGATNPTGTTNVLHFNYCPTPFHVGDTIGVTSVAVAGYNTALPTVSTISSVLQVPPCSVTYSLGSGLAQSGYGFAGNFNGNAIQLQLNIASGGSIDDNIFDSNNFLGAGPTLGSSTAFNMSNNGTTAATTSFNLNQLTHNKVDQYNSVYSMGGSGSLSPTNTKFELGSTTNFTNMFRQWTNSATIAESSSNPTALVGTCTGAVTAAVAQFLYGLGSSGAVAGSVCSTATTENQFVVAKHAGTIQGLFCSGSGTYVGGVVVVRRNSLNTTITCTLAGATPTCNDTTHVPAALVKGDLLSAQITGGTAETGTAPKCTVSVWYQDN